MDAQLFTPVMIELAPGSYTLAETPEQLRVASELRDRLALAQVGQVSYREFVRCAR